MTVALNIDLVAHGGVLHHARGWFGSGTRDDHALCEAGTERGKKTEPI